MTTKDKLICATYALIALLAIPATWINNIAISFTFPLFLLARHLKLHQQVTEQVV